MRRSHRALLPLLPLIPSLLVAAPSYAQTAAPAPAQTLPPPAPLPPAPVAPAPQIDVIPPPPPSSGPLVDLTTLRILRSKGIISEAEFESAQRDLGDSIGTTKVGDANTVVFGKFATTIYGFVEANMMRDSTQSFNDLEGNGQVARFSSNPYGSSNGRVQFSVRNSRLGFRLKAPEIGGCRSSGVIETDFYGNQPAIGPAGGAYATAGLNTAPGSTGSGTATEGQYYGNAAMRVRHAYVKLETPVVDFLFGQTWQLYGWQSVYHPNTVEDQGVPGQIYSRTVQARISKTVKTDSFLFEIAVAAMRPPQRDADVPEGQAGIRIGSPAWSGVTTAGGTGTSIQPISIAVTGDARSFRLPFLKANAEDKGGGNQKVGTSIAVDGFIPIIPAKKRQGNALSVTGEFSTGYGNADLYTGLSGGAPATALPAAAAAAGQTIKPTGVSVDVDPGLVLYDNAGNPHLIGWTSYIFGIQYYLPVAEGKVWLSANYSHLETPNLNNLVSYKGNDKSASLRSSLDWYDVSLFADVTDSVRLAASWSLFDDMYADGAHAQNHRVSFGAWYLF